MNITPIIILYTPVHPIRFQTIIDEVKQAVRQKKQRRLFAINIHNLLVLQDYPTFHTSIKKNDICFADGMPLIWLSRFSHHPLQQRVSGTDLTDALLKKNIPAFLLGSQKNILTIMRKKYPSIVATYSPPFTQHFTRQENKMIIKKIKQAKVKIIYVALGSYRQDQWVIEHSKQFPQCTFITVGSAFDILSGIVPRAPLWMQHMGLEWLWRIWIDPKRLVKRYLEDIYRLLKLLFIHTNPASYKEIFDIHLQKDRYARP